MLYKDKGSILRGKQIMPPPLKKKSLFFDDRADSGVACPHGHILKKAHV